VKVVVLKQADESLRRSLSYLSAHYDRRYLIALEKKVRMAMRGLADNPGAGQFETELDWTNAGYRRLIVRDFKIIYRISDDTIVVNDIFDSRRDPRSMKPLWREAKSLTADKGLIHPRMAHCRSAGAKKRSRKGPGQPFAQRRA
jgi:plasmid stabilization system protein ParE